MDVAFVAQTESCSYLLDADGICRWVIPSAQANENARQVAKRCVGAQYVASLDANEAGLLVHEPKPGRALVFARLDEKGRVSLLRSGTLLEFTAVDSPAAEDPADAKAEEAKTEEARTEEAKTEAPPAPAAAAAPERESEPELLPATVQYPADHVAPPAESDEDITIEGIRAVQQAESEAGVDVDLGLEAEEEDNGETVPFTRERMSSPTLRGVAPPPSAPVVRRRGVLPRRDYAN